MLLKGHLSETTNSLQSSLNAQNTLSGELTSPSHLTGELTQSNSLNGILSETNPSLDGMLQSLGTLSGVLLHKDGLAGSLSNELLRGYSAYQVAVLNGFEGSEQEWLASIKGEKGDEGKTAYEYALEGGYKGTEEEFVIDFVNSMNANLSFSKISEVTLLADKWVGDSSPYSQVVNIDGSTINSQVDLTPSVGQLAVFYEKDLAFVTENYNGVVTVYAIGQKPQNDYTIQVTLTEVLYG